MQQDVVGNQRGVGAQFAAPVAFFAVLDARTGTCREASMAAATRLLMSSILPKRISAGFGGIASAIASAYSASAGAAPMASTISGGSPKRTCSGITSTSRILVKPCSSQESHGFLHQDLGRRSARRQAHGLHVLQPLRLDRAVVLDQVRLACPGCAPLRPGGSNSSCCPSPPPAAGRTRRPRPSPPSGGSRWHSRCPARAAL